MGAPRRHRDLRREDIGQRLLHAVRLTQVPRDLLLATHCSFSNHSTLGPLVHRTVSHRSDPFACARDRAQDGLRLTPDALGAAGNECSRLASCGRLVRARCGDRRAAGRAAGFAARSDSVLALSAARAAASHPRCRPVRCAQRSSEALAGARRAGSARRTEQDPAGVAQLGHQRCSPMPRAGRRRKLTAVAARAKPCSA